MNIAERLGFKIEPVDEVIARYEAQRELAYQALPKSIQGVARSVDAQAGIVRIPRKIEFTLFSRRIELTRMQEFQVGP